MGPFTGARLRTPIFSLVESRSADGSPRVAVTFPNGHRDTLLLNRYSPIEEDERTESCRYIGKLANDHTACVAMTGCPGQQDIELTIMSSHAEGNSLLKWNRDGSVEVVPNPFEVLTLGNNTYYQHAKYLPIINFETNNSDIF